MDLKFTSTDPQLAADMANAHAKAYIEQNLEYRFSASKDATDWLSERLAEQRKKVEAERGRAAAVQGSSTTPSPSRIARTSSCSGWRDLNSAVTKAKTTRIEKEALYNQLKSIQGTPAVESFPAVAGQRLHPEAEVASSATCSASRRSSARSTATAIRR